MDEGRVVDLRSSPECQRTDCRLNAPTFGKENEALAERGSFDDLDNALKPVLYTIDELALVASIHDNRPNPRAKANEPSSQREPTILILNVGRCDIHR